MGRKLRVLNLEDAARDAELLRRHLERANYDLFFERVETPAAMKAALQTQVWDVILSDYSMPQFGALAALALLKESGLDIPFIIISGTIGEEVAVQAMLAGAHDYLMKDKLARLVPAIERELHEAENRRARRQVEESLKASEAELRALFAAMTDVILVLDDQGCYQKIAPTNLMSLPLGELTGKTLHEIFPKAQADFFLQHIQLALHNEQTHKFEYSLQIDGQEVWFEGSISPMSPASVIWIARDITERKQAEEQLKANSAQLRALTASLNSAREEESLRIAREIHDELGSLLTTLRWDLKSIGAGLAKVGVQPPVAALQEKIAATYKLTDTLISTVRRIASELRPSLLDDFGLTDAIEWQAQGFQERTGIRFQCASSVANQSLSQAKSTALFRIFQEASTNVFRHAQATEVEIQMQEEQGDFVLTIRDNGKGITTEQQSGLHSLGLLGMRERAHLVGGELQISGHDGKGTTVKVRVPTSD